MYQNTISNELKEIITRISEDCDITIHEDYSGRFMYGSTCLGLSFEGSAGSLFAAFIRELENAESSTVEEVAEMFEAMRSDNLGLGTIFYFPGWKFDESEGEDEDSEDDVDWDDEETDE